MRKLYVVGIGPGSYDGMTVGAVKALEKADLIVGYTRRWSGAVLPWSMPQEVSPQQLSVPVMPGYMEWLLLSLSLLKNMGLR